MTRELGLYGNLQSCGLRLSRTLINGTRWRHVGAGFLSAALTLPALAGTNVWTAFSGHVPGDPACATPTGSPSFASAVECHRADIAPLIGTNVICGQGVVDTADLGDGNLALTTRVSYDTTEPKTCNGSELGGGDTNSNAGWRFFNSCASVSKEYNGTFGGCVEICVAPETLNTETGECDPPDPPQDPPPEPTPRPDPTGCLPKANPCDLLTGNKIQREVDYVPASGTLSFTRTYNGLSDHPAKEGEFGTPLGTGWFGSYLQYLSAPTGLDSATVSAVRPGGHVIAFTSTLPGSTATQYQFPGEVKERLTVVTNGSGGFTAGCMSRQVTIRSSMTRTDACSQSRAAPVLLRR